MQQARHSGTFGLPPQRSPRLSRCRRWVPALSAFALMCGACVSGDGTTNANGGSPATGGVLGNSATGGTASDPELTRLVTQTPEHMQFAESNDQVAHAGGSWNLTGDRLDFTFGASSFACDGPGAGESGTFDVIELSATDLIVELTSDGDSDRMQFTRVGAGTGINGTWQMRDSDFIITFRGDGSLIASATQDECEGERGPGEDRGYYTMEGCYITALARTSNIVVDGRFDDWATASAVEADDASAGEEAVEISGADLEDLRIAAGPNALFLLLETEDRLNPNFQGRDGDFAGMYEIAIRHDGNGGGTRLVTLIYDPDSERWRDRNGDQGVSVGHGDRGLEIQVQWSALGDPTQVYEIRASSRSCNDGPGSNCQVWDEGPCFGEDSGR